MAYEFNGAAVQRVERFGAELCPVVILDDYLLDTAALMDEAEHAYFGPPPGGFYFGLNAPLPQAYVIALVKALRPTLDSVFGVAAASDIQLMGYFALAVHSAEDLQPVQRVPHYDTSDPGQLALLHYLCGSGQGGTGFYRHDATGFETINETRRARFRLSQSSACGYADGRYFRTSKLASKTAHSKCLSGSGSGHSGPIGRHI